MLNENLIYEIIGKKIKKYREEKQKKQDELAKAIGVSRASIANYENGKQAIYISDLYKIIDYLDIEANDILPSLQEIRSLSLPEESVERALNLDKHEKDELREFIKKSTVKGDENEP